MKCVPSSRAGQRSAMLPHGQPERHVPCVDQQTGSHSRDRTAPRRHHGDDEELRASREHEQRQRHRESHRHPGGCGQGTERGADERDRRCERDGVPDVLPVYFSAERTNVPHSEQ